MSAVPKLKPVEMNFVFILFGGTTLEMDSHQVLASILKFKEQFDFEVGGAQIFMWLVTTPITHLPKADTIGTEGFIFSRETH